MFSPRTCGGGLYLNLLITQMLANSQILKQFRPVRKELKQVQTLINKSASDGLDGDNPAAGFTKLLKGFRGKMIRPALLLLSGRCCGKITAEHIRAAAIVEMLHNATLLHDDVIDEGRIRRGRPTINKLYGNETAVLLGDFLLSRIFILCNGLEPEISRIIAAATARLCVGELAQTAQRRNWKLGEKEYIDVITDKTAYLFRSCCLIGALLAGADKNKSRQLADFGLNFGIAFQIADDLADLTGSENKSGKSTGRDIDGCKPTLALIHLLSTLNQKQRNELIKKLNLPSVDLRRMNRNTIRKLLNSSSSIAYTKDRINKYIDKAIQSLGNLNQTPAGKALIETARFSDTDEVSGQRLH
jgi:octaprenyl-diphosphate synthase